MIEIVRHPRRQKLAKCHGAQFRMPPDTVEIRSGQVEGGKLAEVRRSKFRELVEQAGDGSSCRCGELREPVEFVKGARVALRQDDLRALDPVGLLTVYQV